MPGINKEFSATGELKRKRDLGGPSSVFVKHLSTSELIENLALLYDRPAGLGMDWREGHVCLADMEELAPP